MHISLEVCTLLKVILYVWVVHNYISVNCHCYTLIKGCMHRSELPLKVGKVGKGSPAFI